LHRSEFEAVVVLGNRIGNAWSASEGFGPLLKRGKKYQEESQLMSSLERGDIYSEASRAFPVSDL
tara:strand:- start:222 stop:416 length:195 start_codon:yes stop_codon:yes gene_type:complete